MLHLHVDDLTDAGKGTEQRTQLPPLGLSGTHHPPLAVEAHDPRLLAETAEHQGDAPVLRHVGGGLVAAAGQVQVGDAVGIEQAKTVQTLGREIDVAIIGPGRAGHEVQGLGADELGLLWGDG